MFEPIYVYTIIRKDEIVLAVPSAQPGFQSYEIRALYDQGFIFCCEISAPNPIRAVKIFENNEKLEINKLRQELSRLQAAYNELHKENENLRRNSSYSCESGNSVKYYEIFGFSHYPSEDKLKKRYRFLCQRLHPDKNGDKQLFQLMQRAYQYLTQKSA